MYQMEPLTPEREAPQRCLLVFLWMSYFFPARKKTKELTAFRPHIVKTPLIVSRPIFNPSKQL